MDRIVFYNGEETGHVLETDCFQDSLFREQYSFALKLLKAFIVLRDQYLTSLRSVETVVKEKRLVCVALWNY